MRQRRTFLLLSLVVGVLMMGVAYAAIQNITLTVTGNVAVPQANFSVMFTGSPTYTGTGTAELQLTGDTTAIMNVSGLTVAGDTLEAKFPVINRSPELTAYLSGMASNKNTDYVRVTASVDNTQIAPNGETILNVTVKLIRTPISSSITDEILVELYASPSPEDTGSSEFGNTVFPNSISL